MNKEYTYIDGKVIILDEKRRQKQDVYYDNLDQVLVQENVVEEGERRLKAINKELKEYKGKKYFPYPLLASFMAVALTPLLTYGFARVNPFSEQVGTIVGNINLASFMTAVMASWVAPVGIVINHLEYKKHENKRKTMNGRRREKQFLEKQLVSEKKKLEELKMNKTRNHENHTLHRTVVNDAPALDVLETALDVYFDQGFYDEDDYSTEEEKILVR